MKNNIFFVNLFTLAVFENVKNCSLMHHSIINTWKEIKVMPQKQFFSPKVKFRIKFDSIWEESGLSWI